MDLEKTLLRKVGEAVARFKMIRDGDRVAVASQHPPLRNIYDKFCLAEKDRLWQDRNIF